MKEEQKLLEKMGEALKKKKWKKATELAKKVLIYNISSSEAYRTLGMSSFYTGNLQQARRYFEQAKEIKEDADIDCRLAFTALYLDNDEQAEGYFNAALERDRKFAPAYYGLAFLYQKKNDLERALRFLERAHQLQPFPDLIMEPPGESETKRRLRNFLSMHLPKTSTAKKQRLHPYDREKEKAKKLKEKGRYLEALEILQPLLRKLPEDIPLLVETALCYFFTKRYELATPLFQKASQLAPEDPQIFYYLGSSLTKQGRYIQAQRAYEAAITKNPQFAEALYSLGFVMEKQGDLKKAYDFMEKAMAINPHTQTMIFSERPSSEKEKQRQFAEPGCLLSFYSLLATFFCRMLYQLFRKLPLKKKNSWARRIQWRIEEAIKKQEKL